MRKVFQNDLVNYLNNKSEILVPIPVSEKAMESRGFNQVIGLIENIEYCECLKALNNKKNQSKKNRKERLQTKQPFSIISDQIKLVEGKEVILIDDIYTTGVTLRHATNLLLHNGVKKVRSLTLAR
ncbi:ComF family protein [Lactobacillus sp. S2-2]|uniref:ComF family protein n=1 Tax=Lactobacillus sp. S2-2 TaxID=2692917 RepID=UPI001F29E8A7|nr:phosphoribosyltransferase family protein [Lactobacillus sp. S2-2]MCF6515682.1 ComF family protein [Lactobacillus sp. S2-2]